MLDTLYIEKRLEEEVEIKQIALELKMNYEILYKVLRTYDVEINYQKYVLRNELCEFLKRNNLQKLIQTSGIDQKIYNKMMKKEEITFRALVRVLNFFNIPFKLKLRKREEVDYGKAWSRFIVDFPNRIEWERKGKEVNELKDKRGEQLYSHLITSHTNKLRDIMANKNIGSMTESRIMATVIDILKESANLGMIIERNQDDQILNLTIKAIEQGKVIDIDKDVL